MTSTNFNPQIKDDTKQFNVRPVRKRPESSYKAKNTVEPGKLLHSSQSRTDIEAHG